MNPSREGWTERKLTLRDLSLVLLMMIQLSGLIWWAANMRAGLDTLGAAVVDLKGASRDMNSAVGELRNGVTGMEARLRVLEDRDQRRTR